ncbi:alpha/beta hydrolase [Stutzerimonas azotifigens]|uniref:alpha/beta hydrolase n=1 Tax=Stutzerimonas azotifigens TaxID=291995 RepID=UPI0004051512|nr:alpha/beta hydrolase [Stutzerimonas azotifigens]
MPATLFARRSVRLLLWLGLFLLVVLPVGCSVLAQKERELVFRIEQGDASWYGGLPAGVQELDLETTELASDQSLHAWWWPAEAADAPAVLYLHGVRWNLTGHLFRIRELRALGFSVLAVDYRGFGKSRGPLPSERSVYQDARIAWQHLARLQPDAGKRLIYGHSLGGAVAVDLALQLNKGDLEPTGARGLILESTFTNLGDIAAVLADTRWPVRWLLSQEFDSLDKIGQVELPVLIVHGTQDRYVPPRFGQALYDAASGPKELLLVEGATHNNSMRMAREEYARAIARLFGPAADERSAGRAEDRPPDAS